jgi:alkaline phosphatase
MDAGGKEGFFIMVEGGKIDWACHANDAVATIGDMLDFDNAVGVALDFYKKHPHETLIVVTGDHETGGMTIGHATTAIRPITTNCWARPTATSTFGEPVGKLHKEKYSAGYDWTLAPTTWRDQCQND